MIAVLFLFFLAAANAAPHFSSRDDDCGWSCFNHDIFDTQKFWQDMESELNALDEMIRNLQSQTSFRVAGSTAGIVDNQYKVLITLSGYVDKDIVVKAREGVLMVQAVHKVSESYTRNYLEIRTLPDVVDATGGVWTFDNEQLKIVFPLKGGATTETDVETTTQAVELVTRGQETREELDKTDNNNNQDADVGVRNENKDSSKETAINTNEIQNGVEATTYAVDLKNEVEFVPVYYRK